MKKSEKSDKRKSLGEAWADLFAKNEAIAKAGKRPMTDQELSAAMAKQFPDKAGRTTITRVSMIRGIYNSGANLFEKAGPAGKSGRPVSKPYNPDGKGRMPSSETIAPTRPMRKKLVLKRR